MYQNDMGHSDDTNESEIWISALKWIHDGTDWKKLIEFIKLAKLRQHFGD